MCQKCNGTGYDCRNEKMCSACNGSGNYTETLEKTAQQKTLLDEFAIAILPTIVARRPYITDRDNALETLKKIIDAEVAGAYIYADSMMKEREKRNVTMTIGKNK